MYMYMSNSLRYVTPNVKSVAINVSFSFNIHAFVVIKCGYCGLVVDKISLSRDSGSKV